MFPESGIVFVARYIELEMVMMTHRSIYSRTILTQAILLLIAAVFLMSSCALEERVSGEENVSKEELPSPKDYSIDDEEEPLISENPAKEAAKIPDGYEELRINVGNGTETDESVGSIRADLAKYGFSNRNGYYLSSGLPNVSDQQYTIILYSSEDLEEVALSICEVLELSLEPGTSQEDNSIERTLLNPSSENGWLYHGDIFVLVGEDLLAKYRK